jgi:hypothetical protein
MALTRPGLAHHNSEVLMHSAPYPTDPTPGPALHLLDGRTWIASCPLCGYQLTTARSQERCERRAARRTCPICRPATVTTKGVA